MFKIRLKYIKYKQVPNYNKRLQPQDNSPKNMPIQENLRTCNYDNSLSAGTVDDGTHWIHAFDFTHDPEKRLGKKWTRPFFFKASC